MSKYKTNARVFYGKRNRSKMLVLCALSWHRDMLHFQSGLTSRRLSEVTGVSFSYLTNRLSHWLRWQYLVVAGASRVANSHLPAFTYSLAKEGERLMSYCPTDKITEYINALDKDYLLGKPMPLPVDIPRVKTPTPKRTISHSSGRVRIARRSAPYERQESITRMDCEPASIIDDDVPDFDVPDFDIDEF